MGKPRRKSLAEVARAESQVAINLSEKIHYEIIGSFDPFPSLFKSVFVRDEWFRVEAFA